MNTISLLTDFGEGDGFVGMLKGTILKIAPECRIIDITHDVPSFDIRVAAFILERSIRYYPDGTVFLVIVDSGVGTDRKIIAARAGGYCFVGPDNGVLSYALSQFNDCKLVSVENEKLFLHTASRTFDGRDKMAPVVAHMARGAELEKFGPVLTKYSCLKRSNLLQHVDRVIGEIVHVDKFGNMISNISSSDLPAADLSLLCCCLGEFEGIEFADSYLAGKGLSAVISGFETVEIYLPQGRASDKLGQAIGTTLAVSVKR